MSDFFDRISVAAARLSWTVHTRSVLMASAVLAGQKFRIPLMHGLGLTLLRYSPSEIRFVELLRRLMAARQGLVIDVGANVGRFLMFVAAVDRGKQYLGFEVHLKCAFYIKKLIQSNELTNYRIFPIGLAEEDGATMLHTNDDEDLCASTTPNFYRSDLHRDTYPVGVMRGDTVLKSLSAGRVAVIKIDVEGGELEVLRGMSGVLESDKPALIVEVAPYAHVSDEKVASFRRERALELERFLRGFGYSFWRIRSGEQLDAVDTLNAGTSTDTSEMDYLCLSGPGWESVSG